MLDSKAPKSAPHPASCPVDRHIGGRATERRQALGLAIGDVAHTLEVDGASLDQLEGGHQRFAARQLWKLSRRLQVPMAWFFKIPGEPSQPQAPPRKAPSSETVPAEPKPQLIFVPNPDLDRWDDAEAVRIH